MWTYCNGIPLSMFSSYCNAVTKLYNVNLFSFVHDIFFRYSSSDKVWKQFRVYFSSGLRVQNSTRVCSRWYIQHLLGKCQTFDNGTWVVFPRKIIVYKKWGGDEMCSLVEEWNIKEELINSEGNLVGFVLLSYILFLMITMHRLMFTTIFGQSWGTFWSAALPCRDAFYIRENFQ